MRHKRFIAALVVSGAIVTGAGAVDVGAQGTPSPPAPPPGWCPPSESCPPPAPEAPPPIPDPPRPTGRQRVDQRLCELADNLDARAARAPTRAAPAARSPPSAHSRSLRSGTAPPSSWSFTFLGITYVCSDPEADGHADCV